MEFLTTLGRLMVMAAVASVVFAILYVIFHATELLLDILGWIDRPD